MEMGKSDTNNSLSYLIGWWTTEGNYNHFRGNSRGEKKKDIAYKLTIEMNKISRHNQTGKVMVR